jgi:chaperone modulatory protein CbpM
MKAILAEMLWLDEHNTISLSELSELSGLSSDDLNELVDCGIIEPVRQGMAQIAFHARCVLTAKTARRLRDDFELDAPGLALAMTLIERMHELEARLRELTAKLPRGPSGSI